MIDDDLRVLIAFVRESASRTYDYAGQQREAAPFEPIPYDQDRLEGEAEYLAKCAFRLFNIAKKIERGIKINQADYDLAAGDMQLNNREFLPILRQCLR